MTLVPDAHAIETGLKRDRARLSETLEALNDRVSADSLARQALGLIRSNAAAYTSSIDSAVRSNPLALTVTGIGLAWLIFGGRKPATPDPSDETFARWEDEGGNPLPRSSLAARATDRAGATWSDKLDALRDTASTALRRLEGDARSYAGDVKDFAAERAKILKAFTADMRDTLQDGLDGLSETARDRIVKARETAYSAHLRAADTARAGGREAGRLVNEHPMIAGAIAMALGAAFAAALPRTRIEDRTFGEESDRLMHRAAALLSEERDRMARVAEGVADELKASARDVADTAAAKAAELGENLRDRAATEAGSTTTL